MIRTRLRRPKRSLKTRDRRGSTRREKRRVFIDGQRLAKRERGAHYRATLSTLRYQSCARFGHLPVGWLGPIYCDICHRVIGYDPIAAAETEARWALRDAGLLETTVELLDEDGEPFPF